MFQNLLWEYDMAWISVRFPGPEIFSQFAPGFHPPIFMHILEYRIKNAGWKRQDMHKLKKCAYKMNAHIWVG